MENHDVHNYMQALVEKIMRYWYHYMVERNKTKVTMDVNMKFELFDTRWLNCSVSGI